MNEWSEESRFEALRWVFQVKVSLLKKNKQNLVLREIRSAITNLELGNCVWGSEWEEGVMDAGKTKVTERNRQWDVEISPFSFDLLLKKNRGGKISVTSSSCWRWNGNCHYKIFSSCSFYEWKMKRRERW